LIGAIVTEFEFVGVLTWGATKLGWAKQICMLPLDAFFFIYEKQNGGFLYQYDKGGMKKT